MVHIGTSGWSYKHWQEIFYPLKWPKSQHFEYYCQQFKTVEINSSFYHLPKDKTFAGWSERSSAEFVFSVKASRYITHMKRLNDIEEPLSRLLSGCMLLQEKAGPLLFQLPPNFKKDENKLINLLALLPSNIKAVFEFRHPTWFETRVYAILEQFKAGFCWHDFKQMLCPEIVTGKLAYVRLHGPDGYYTSKYSDEYLKALAARIQEYHQNGCEVYVYFNNDYQGYAIENALKLKKLVSNG